MVDLKVKVATTSCSM